MSQAGGGIRGRRPSGAGNRTPGARWPGPEIPVASRTARTDAELVGPGNRSSSPYHPKSNKVPCLNWKPRKNKISMLDLNKCMGSYNAPIRKFKLSPSSYQQNQKDLMEIKLNRVLLIVRLYQYNTLSIFGRIHFSRLDRPATKNLDHSVSPKLPYQLLEPSASRVVDWRIWMTH